MGGEKKRSRMALRLACPKSGSQTGFFSPSLCSTAKLDTCTAPRRCGRWGRPGEGFHAIQIELNRALYMDETSLSRRREGMHWLAGLCQDLVQRLAAVDARAQLGP